MKNFIGTSILLFFMIILAVNTNAQQYTSVKSTVKKGQVSLNASVGLTPTFLCDKSELKVLPLTLSGDYMLTQKLSLGIHGGYSKTNTRPKIYTLSDKGHAYDIEAQWQNVHSELGVRVLYHYTELEKWDVYGGMMFTYTHNKITALRDDLDTLEMHLGIKEHNRSFTPIAVLGTKYAINDQLSLLSEVSYGVSLVRAGLSYRLN